LTSIEMKFSELWDTHFLATKGMKKFWRSWK
jgi:hypothetical protein